MASQEHESSTRRRYWMIAAAFVVWTMVVIAGAGTNAGDSLLGVDHLEIVWIASLGLMALFGLLVLISLRPFADGWVEPDKPTRGGVRAALVLLVILLVWRPELLDRLRQQTESEGAGFGPASPGVEVDETPAVETVAQLSDLLLLFAFTAAIGGVWFLLRRRADGDDSDFDDGEQPDVAALEADLAVELEKLAASMKVAHDPRAAVLAAYAVLEALLADHGFRRDRAETATEHLRRSLVHNRIDASPIVHLGELYEVARFSEHPITARDQAEALASLQQARTALTSLA